MRLPDMTFFACFLICIVHSCVSGIDNLNNSSNNDINNNNNNIQKNGSDSLLNSSHIFSNNYSSIIINSGIRLKNNTITGRSYRDNRGNLTIDDDDSTTNNNKGDRQSTKQGIIIMNDGDANRFAKQPIIKKQNDSTNNNSKKSKANEKKLLSDKNTTTSIKANENDQNADHHIHNNQHHNSLSNNYYYNEVIDNNINATGGEIFSDLFGCLRADAMLQCFNERLYFVVKFWRENLMRTIKYKSLGQQDHKQLQQHHQGEITFENGLLHFGKIVYDGVINLFYGDSQNDNNATTIDKISSSSSDGNGGNSSKEARDSTGLSDYLNFDEDPAKDERGHHKKKKAEKAVKKFILKVILAIFLFKLKIKMLLGMLQSILISKLIVAATIYILTCTFKIWHEIKKGKHQHEHDKHIIYYDSAHHDHTYHDEHPSSEYSSDHDDISSYSSGGYPYHHHSDDSSSSSGGGGWPWGKLWGRSFTQKPTDGNIFIKNPNIPGPGYKPMIAPPVSPATAAAASMYRYPKKQTNLYGLSNRGGDDDAEISLFS